MFNFSAHSEKAIIAIAALVTLFFFWAAGTMLFGGSIMPPLTLKPASKAPVFITVIPGEPKP